MVRVIPRLLALESAPSLQSRVEARCKNLSVASFFCKQAEAWLDLARVMLTHDA